MSGAILGYRDLEVWQLAMDFAVECYRVTGSFPAEESYGMVRQIRRAAVSVPANIAEGRGRRSTAEFIRHLNIACGSLAELETHLMLANRLDYLDAQLTEDLLLRTGRIGKMLNALRASLRSRANSNPPPPDP